MNDNVGKEIKDLAGLEWFLGITSVVFEVIVMILVLLLLRGLRADNPFSAVMSYATWRGSIRLLSIGVIIGFVASIVKTLYIHYKQKLLLYAYGKLSADVSNMKKTLHEISDR